MGKYEPLGEFLRSQRTREVPLTFREIEHITGVKLPPKAQHHRAWWSNNPSNNVMTKVWLAAGYESTQVDLSARKLVFRRVEKAGAEKDLVADAQRPGKKGERHPLLGALKGLVIIPPGVDLTEPADPDWADRLDEKYGPEVR
jgi:hypothetical protein